MLTFEQLAQMNASRLVKWHKGTAWSTADWVTAVTGGIGRTGVPGEDDESDVVRTEAFYKTLSQHMKERELWGRVFARDRDHARALGDKLLPK